jgi:hypothetical protein
MIESKETDPIESPAPTTKYYSRRFSHFTTSIVIRFGNIANGRILPTFTRHFTISRVLTGIECGESQISRGILNRATSGLIAFGQPNNVRRWDRRQIYCFQAKEDKG